MNGFVSTLVAAITVAVALVLGSLESTATAQLPTPISNLPPFDSRAKTAREQRDTSATPENSFEITTPFQSGKIQPNNTPASDLKKLLHEPRPEDPRPRPALLTRDIEIPKINMKLKALGNNWVRHPEFESRNIGLMAMESEMAFALKASRETLGTASSMTLREARESILRQIEQETGTPPKLVNSKPCRALGLEGEINEIHHRSKVRDSDIIRFSWYCIDRGYLYIIEVLGKSEHREQLNEVGPIALSRFSLINPTDTAPVQHAFFHKQESPDWGMALDFTGTGWQQSESGRRELGPSRMAMSRPLEGRVEVHSFRYFEETPPSAAVTATLLRILGAYVGQREIDANSLTPITFRNIPAVRGERRIDNKIFTFVVVTGQKNCWLVVCMRPANSAWSADNVFDRVFLTEPQFPPNPRYLPFETRKEQGGFCGLLSMQIANIDPKNPLVVSYARQARELIPEDPRSFFGLVEALDLQGQYDEAIALLENAPGRLVNNVDSQRMLAQLLTRVNRRRDALVIYRRLLGLRSLPVEDFETVLALVQQEDNLKSTLEWIDDFDVQDPSPNWTFLKARLLTDAGKKDEAVELLRKLRKSMPRSDTQLTIGIIDALLSADRVDEALQEVDDLEKLNKDQVVVKLYRGLCQFKQERWQEARASFQKVLEINPHHQDAKKLLEIVAVRLGQGEVSEVSHQIPAVPLPAAVLNAAVSKPVLKDGDNAWYELSAKAIHFEPKRDYRRTLTRVIHIRNREAIEEFRTLTFPFHPMAEQVAVNRVDVFDDAGEKVGSVDVSDCFVKPYHEDNLALSKKALCIPVPGLRPKCRIEVQVTYRDLRVPERFPFIAHDLAHDQTVARSVLFVTGAISQLNFQGPPSSQVENGLLWQMQNVERRADEPNQDHLAYAPTVVCLTDRSNNWKQEADEYLRDLNERLVVSESVKQLASKLLAGHEQDRAEERVNLLTNWVQQQLTYQGLEFGRRAMIMPPVEQTLRQRFGDCKDHSLLLYQLLHASGFKPHLTLANPMQPIVATLPSLDQFNHMIVAVTDDRGERVLDVTGKYFDTALRVPPGLAGTQVLVLDPEQPRMLTVGDYPRDSARVMIDRTIKLRTDGSASIQEVVTFNDYAAASYREMFASQTPERRREVINALFVTSNQAKLRDFQIEGLNDNSKPIEVRLNYEQLDVVHEVSGTMIGRLPGGFESQWFEVLPNANRRSAFRFQQYRDVSQRVRLALPDGFEIAEVPSNVSKAHRLIDQVRTAKAQTDGLEIQSRARRRKGMFEAGDWTEYADVSQEAKLLFTPKIQLRQSAVRQVKRTQ